MKKINGYFTLNIFADQPKLVQAFSTREFGDLKVGSILDSNRNLDRFLLNLGIDKTNLVMMEQVHGSKIRMVGKSDKGKVIRGVDGLITDKKGLYLGVNTADCLPLFFYDPKRKLFGLAHAGWKGILLRVAQKMVKEMKKRGSNPEKIIVAIGPHIGSCCYRVSNDLAKKYKKKFGNLAKMFYRDKEGVHLDLAIPIIVQLIKEGVDNDKIEVARNCTCCQKRDFFSYRREGKKKTFGEMLGVIGLTN